ncbi:MAG: FKBP-type peptidyl-prolyl cis-trans isomerase [Bacteroidetes bacterium]|nr:FKBP-type peptidyl-prolyl cis-trans isomerase [Bacteroidota bacterium]
MNFFCHKDSGYIPMLLISIFICFFFYSCDNTPQSSSGTKHFGNIKDSIINYNKKIVRTEDQQIEDFIARYQWKMNKTTTGLRYMIYKKGDGPQAKKGMIATLDYSIRLLSGDLINSSAGKAPLVFKIGHGGVESGLEEGILFLHKGDHVKFIVPSHLAFGLMGDQDKIPPGATLVYNVELINLK